MGWSEIDLDKALWSLPGSRTKNRKPHAVALSTQAVAILEALPRREGRDHVFGEGDGPFSGWSRCKVRLARRCGVAGFTLHDLRRSAGTWMHEIGTEPHIVEAILNHYSGHKGGVAGIYNRATYGPQKARAMQAWADHLLGTAPTKEVPLHAAGAA